MAASEYAVARVPVSMRLPASIAEQIERRAKEKGVSKTEALLYYVKVGMESESIARQLEGMRNELKALRRVVENGPIGRMSDMRSVQTAVAQSASYFPAIRRAYLFGSFARGDFNEESDIDVRIERDEETSFNLRDLSQFASLIEHATGREVDVVSAKHLENANLASAIEREKVLVYEREEG